MAFIETDALVKVRDIEGKEYLIYPVTKAENVQGLDTFIGNILDTSGSEIAQGVGVKFDGTKDKLVVYNPYSNQWVETDITTGKIILPSTITVNTTSLGGQAVTCTIGEESYTTTFVVTEGTSGVAVFTVYSDGVATITCGEFSVEITVAEKGGQILTTELEEKVKLMLVKNGTPMNGARWGDATKNRLVYESSYGSFTNKTLCYKNVAQATYKEIQAKVYVYGNSTSKLIRWNKTSFKIDTTGDYNTPAHFRWEPGEVVSVDLEAATILNPSKNPKNSAGINEILCSVANAADVDLTLISMYMDVWLE